MCTGTRICLSILMASVFTSCSTNSANNAEAWLESASKATQRYPSRCEYDAVNGWVKDGVAIVCELTGIAVCSGPMRCRTEIDGVAYAQLDPLSRGKVHTLTVRDGTYEWMETETWKGDRSTTSSRTVIKGPLEALPGGPCGIDGLVSVAKNFTARSVDQQVVIEERWPEGFHVRVVLDQATSRPLEKFTASPDGQSSQMKIKSWAFPETVDPSLFIYEPPEGVPVTVVDAEEARR